MSDYPQLRRTMVEQQIAARGVRSEAVLNALRKVPRELFLPERLREFAYDDAPLPIEAAQTISQPYIVALMTEALALKGGENVLEIGTGSGYAAAVLAEIAGEVYTVERIEQLADTAALRLADLGYKNVHVRHGDGTLGWAEHAPYDAIIVAAGGPQIPDTLKRQLKVGGRLVIPVGADQRAQELVRVTRSSNSNFKTEDIADVRFVPLVGQEGWLPEESPFLQREGPRARPVDGELARAIGDTAESFDSIEAADLDHSRRYGCGGVRLGWSDGNQSGAACAGSKLRKALSRSGPSSFHVTASSSGGGHAPAGIEQASSGTRDRGDLPSGDGARQSLL